jgi:hypothetical protein
MKAINVILARERLDRERKKKEENKRARLELDSPQDGVAAPFAPLAPNAGAPTLNTNVAPMVPGEPSRRMQIYQVENLSRGSPISTSVYTPPESSDSPVVPGRGSFGNGEGGHLTAVNANPGQATPVQSVIEGVWDRLATGGMAGSRNGSISSQPAINAGAWPAVSAAAQATERRRSSLATEIKFQPASQAATNAPLSNMRQLSADISKLVSDLTRTSDNTNGQAASGTGSLTAAEDGLRGPYGGLDEDVLRALRAYIYREDTGVTWEEEPLLSRLEAAWRSGVRSDDKIMLENVPVFIARERAFLTWIELKRHLADLDRADKRT